MSKEDLKQTRIETLKQVQANRKEDSRERVYKAIERLQKVGGKLNFHTIAKEADVSVSYLYKYPEIKQHIAQIRSQHSSLPNNLAAKSISSQSHTKVVTHFKQRIHQLEEENHSLRRKNEALAGQVYRVHLLQAQVENQQRTIENLQTKLNELQAQPFVSKVTPITQVKTQNPNESIPGKLNTLGIKLTNSLKQVIKEHSEEAVLLAMQAYQQYRETHPVRSPAGCLRRAIEEGWVPNQESTPSTPDQDEFDKFYKEAVAQGFLLDIPKNHLPVQGGEIMVKINRTSAFAPWTIMYWRDAKIEYEEKYTNK